MTTEWLRRRPFGAGIVWRVNYANQCVHIHWNGSGTGCALPNVQSTRNPQWFWKVQRNSIESYGICVDCKSIQNEILRFSNSNGNGYRLGMQSIKNDISEINHWLLPTRACANEHRDTIVRRGVDKDWCAECVIKQKRSSIEHSTNDNNYSEWFTFIQHRKDWRMWMKCRWIESYWIVNEGLTRSLNGFSFVRMNVDDVSFRQKPFGTASLKTRNWWMAQDLNGLEWKPNRMDSRRGGSHEAIPRRSSSQLQRNSSSKPLAAKSIHRSCESRYENRSEPKPPTDQRQERPRQVWRWSSELYPVRDPITSQSECAFRETPRRMTIFRWGEWISNKSPANNLTQTFLKQKMNSTMPRRS